MAHCGRVEQEGMQRNRSLGHSCPSTKQWQMPLLEIDDPRMDEKRGGGSCCEEETGENKEIIALEQG